MNHFQVLIQTLEVWSLQFMVEFGQQGVEVQKLQEMKRQLPTCPTISLSIFMETLKLLDSTQDRNLLDIH